MYSQAEKPTRANRQSIANSLTQMNSGKKRGATFVDNRSQARSQLTTNNPIQREVIRDGEFSNRGNFYQYYSAFKSSLPNTIYNDQRTDLIITTKDYGGRKYGNTQCEVWHANRWHDIDKTNTWRHASANAKARITIRIDGSAIGNLQKHQVIETLVHEWELHGMPFYRFINKNLRHSDISSKELIDRFDERNSRGGYLNVDDQHGRLYRSRHTTHMDESIAMIGAKMSIDDAEDLYDEYATDARDHRRDSRGHIPSHDHLFRLENRLNNT